MVSEKPIILVDGSSYLYRAYHGLPPLINSQQQATGAIFGVVNMLKSLQQRYQPDYMAVIFDAKGKTFRHEMYDAYKAHRPPMPEDLRSQIEPLHDIVRNLGFPLICISGVEADDVIGTLTNQAINHNQPIIVSTGDKDLAQLVNSHVTLINTMTNKLLDPKGVEEKFGIPPERIIDYLALVGDTSDNIPGIQKVGPKTAVKWLQQYGTLDDIVEHASEIKGKVGEYLRSGLEQLALSKRLTTIKLDVALDLELPDLALKEKNTEALAELYEKLEFKSWLNNLTLKKPTPPPEKDYQTILSEEQLMPWLEKLQSAKVISFDTETDSLNYMNAQLVGFSFSVKRGQACYVPVAHDYEDAPTQISRDRALALIKPILENPDLKKIGQNLKYDMEVLKNYDITLQGIFCDTMLESYVYNSVANRHDMDTLALKYLNRTTIKFTDVAGKGAKQVTFNKVDLETAGPYAAEDADITLQLHEYFFHRIKEINALSHVLETIELPLIPALCTMERNGVLIDSKKLGEQSAELATRLQEIESQSYDLAGSEFNLNSPAQLQEILYEKMQLPILKKTPKGQPSTAEPVLTELALDYPLPKLIIEHRQLSKLKSTYTDQLPKQVNQKTGRVHSSFHQAITATGRLSSSDPNLQNIPVRREEGRKIRQAFIAAPGKKIIAADYSQIELRIMAHLSQDKGLLNAFANNLDVHSATAAEIFNTPIDNVSKEQRRSAKAINFGLIYGMSAFGLAKQLNIERQAARNYIEKYFERYPGVSAYMEETRQSAHNKGYVETLFGRRLYLPLINAKNKGLQQAAERTAINAPMQGTAADIIKLAMIELAQWLSQQNGDIKMIMQVHDELVFEVDENIVDTIVPVIKDKMQSAASLDVPLLVDVGIGDNWDEAH
jgi:DNA polymerase I